jgi:interferon-induced GTP-binding protein Mx1
VLTKPDLINPGGEAEVLEVLANRKKPLKLGYLMLKNLSQKQLNDAASGGGLSAAEARQAEMDFFESSDAFRCVMLWCNTFT